MSPMLKTIILLALSNVFMTLAWYAHLKDMNDKKWWIAALASWGIALFEYLLQVPANRAGHTVMTISQLKILQEAIALSVFVPVAVLYFKEKITLNYLWAALCIMGAVYFIMRDKGKTATPPAPVAAVVDAPAAANGAPSVPPAAP